MTEHRGLYDLRFSPTEQRRKAEVWRVLVARAFQRWVPRESVVLDLGCGFGEFVNTIVAGRRLAVDLSDRFADQLEPDIEFHVGDICALDWLDDDSVDVVFTSNVLEHLSSRDHVARTIGEVRRVLRPGGALIAMGPNIRYLPGPYWDFWDHIVPISDRSLCELLEMVGFEPLDVVPRFLPYTTKGRLPVSARLVSLYLRLPVLWPLLGRQFLIHARAL